MDYERFEKGEVVRLDADFNNSSIVEVISQSPRKLFTRIKDENSDWEVMTDRLSHIEIEDVSKSI
jgi:hypothetical protein